jgi:hypothetical protein
VTVLWLALAVAAGFAAGHYRLPGRLFDWAYAAAIGDRRGLAWAAGVPLALLGLAVHPRRSIRYARSWRRADERAPAPQMDPEWGRR